MRLCVDGDVSGMGCRMFVSDAVVQVVIGTSSGWWVVLVR